MDVTEESPQDGLHSAAAASCDHGTAAAEPDDRTGWFGLCEILLKKGPRYAGVVLKEKLERCVREGSPLSESLLPYFLKHFFLKCDACQLGHICVSDWCLHILCGGESPSLFLKQLRSRANTTAPTMCAKFLGEGEFVYSCRTCQLGTTSVLCTTCFQEGHHEGHDYSLQVSSGGTCDCGDVGWKATGVCATHRHHQQLAAESQCERRRRESLNASQRNEEHIATTAFRYRVQVLMSTLVSYVCASIHSLAPHPTHQRRFTSVIKVLSWTRKLAKGTSAGASMGELTEALGSALCAPFDEQISTALFSSRFLHEHLLVPAAEASASSSAASTSALAASPSPRPITRLHYFLHFCYQPLPHFGPSRLDRLLSELCGSLLAHADFKSALAFAMLSPASLYCTPSPPYSVYRRLVIAQCRLPSIVHSVVLTNPQMCAIIRAQSGVSAMLTHLRDVFIVAAHMRTPGEIQADTERKAEEERRATSALMASLPTAGPSFPRLTSNDVTLGWADVERAQQQLEAHMHLLDESLARLEQPALQAQPLVPPATGRPVLATVLEGAAGSVANVLPRPQPVRAASIFGPAPPLPSLHASPAEASPPPPTSTPSAITPPPAAAAAPSASLLYGQALPDHWAATALVPQAAGHAPRSSTGGGASNPNSSSTVWFLNRQHSLSYILSGASSEHRIADWNERCLREDTMHDLPAGVQDVMRLQMSLGLPIRPLTLDASSPVISNHVFMQLKNDLMTLLDHDEVCRAALFTPDTITRFLSLCMLFQRMNPQLRKLGAHVAFEKTDAEMKNYFYLEILVHKTFERLLGQGLAGLANETDTQVKQPVPEDPIRPIARSGASAASHPPPSPYSTMHRALPTLPPSTHGLLPSVSSPSVPLRSPYHALNLLRTLQQNRNGDASPAELAQAEQTVRNMQQRPQHGGMVTRIAHHPFSPLILPHSLRPCGSAISADDHLLFARPLPSRHSCPRCTFPSASPLSPARLSSLRSILHNFANHLVFDFVANQLPVTEPSLFHTPFSAAYHPITCRVLQSAMSVHLPMQRMFARTLAHCITRADVNSVGLDDLLVFQPDLTDIDLTLSPSLQSGHLTSVRCRPLSFWLCFLELPLRVTAFVSQLRAKSLWIRNGFDTITMMQKSYKHTANFWRRGFGCDLAAMQIASVQIIRHTEQTANSARLPPIHSMPIAVVDATDLLVQRLAERFDVQWWVHLDGDTAVSSTARLPSSVCPFTTNEAITLGEDFLKLVHALVCDRSYYVCDLAVLRCFIIHTLLAYGDVTHSQLVQFLPAELAIDQTGGDPRQTTPGDNVDAILAEVATFLPPPEVPTAATAAKCGVYRLKPAFWSGAVLPSLYWKFTAQELVSAEDKVRSWRQTRGQPSRTANSTDAVATSPTEESGATTPPSSLVLTLPSSMSHFDSLLSLLHTPTLHAFLFTLLSLAVRSMPDEATKGTPGPKLPPVEEKVPIPSPSGPVRGGSSSGGSFRLPPKSMVPGADLPLDRLAQQALHLLALALTFAPGATYATTVPATNWPRGFRMQASGTHLTPLVWHESEEAAASVPTGASSPDSASPSSARLLCLVSLVEQLWTRGHMAEFGPEMKSVILLAQAQLGRPAHPTIVAPSVSPVEGDATTPGSQVTLVGGDARTLARSKAKQRQQKLMARLSNEQHTIAKHHGLAVADATAKRLAKANTRVENESKVPPSTACSSPASSPPSVDSGSSSSAAPSASPSSSPPALPALHRATSEPSFDNARCCLCHEGAEAPKTDGATAEGASAATPGMGTAIAKVLGSVCFLTPTGLNAVTHRVHNHQLALRMAAAAVGVDSLDPSSAGSPMHSHASGSSSHHIVSADGYAKQPLGALALFHAVAQQLTPEVLTLQAPPASHRSARSGRPTTSRQPDRIERESRHLQRSSNLAAPPPLLQVAATHLRPSSLAVPPMHRTTSAPPEVASATSATAASSRPFPFPVPSRSILKRTHDNLAAPSLPAASSPAAAAAASSAALPSSLQLEPPSLVPTLPPSDDGLSDRPSLASPEAAAAQSSADRSLVDDAALARPSKRRRRSAADITSPPSPPRSAGARAASPDEEKEIEEKVDEADQPARPRSARARERPTPSSDVAMPSGPQRQRATSDAASRSLAHLVIPSLLRSVTQDVQDLIGEPHEPVASSSPTNISPVPSPPSSPPPHDATAMEEVNGQVSNPDAQILVRVVQETLPTADEMRRSRRREFRNIRDANRRAAAAAEARAHAAEATARIEAAANNGVVPQPGQATLTVERQNPGGGTTVTTQLLDVSMLDGLGQGVGADGLTGTQTIANAILDQVVQAMAQQQQQSAFAPMAAATGPPATHINTQHRTGSLAPSRGQPGSGQSSHRTSNAAQNITFDWAHSLGLHLQTCKHYMHIGCLENYLSSKYGRAPTPSGWRQGAPFLCPACRRLSNVIIPIGLEHQPQLNESEADATSSAMQTGDEPPVASSARPRLPPPLELCVPTMIVPIKNRSRRESTAASDVTAAHPLLLLPAPLVSPSPPDSVWRGVESWLEWINRRISSESAGGVLPRSTAAAHVLVEVGRATRSPTFEGPSAAFIGVIRHFIHIVTYMLRGHQSSGGSSSSHHGGGGGLQADPFPVVPGLNMLGPTMRRRAGVGVARDQAAPTDLTAQPPLRPLQIHVPPAFTVNPTRSPDTRPLSLSPPPLPQLPARAQPSAQDTREAHIDNLFQRLQEITQRLPSRSAELASASVPTSSASQPQPATTLTPSSMSAYQRIFLCIMGNTCSVWELAIRDQPATSTASHPLPPFTPDAGLLLSSSAVFGFVPYLSSLVSSRASSLAAFYQALPHHLEHRQHQVFKQLLMLYRLTRQHWRGLQHQSGGSSLAATADPLDDLQFLWQMLLGAQDTDSETSASNSSATDDRNKPDARGGVAMTLPLLSRNIFSVLVQFTPLLLRLATELGDSPPETTKVGNSSPSSTPSVADHAISVLRVLYLAVTAQSAAYVSSLGVTESPADAQESPLIFAPLAHASLKRKPTQSGNHLHPDTAASGWKKTKLERGVTVPIDRLDQMSDDDAAPTNTNGARAHEERFDPRQLDDHAARVAYWQRMTDRNETRASHLAPHDLLLSSACMADVTSVATLVLFARAVRLRLVDLTLPYQLHLEQQRDRQAAIKASGQFATDKAHWTTLAHALTSQPLVAGVEQLCAPFVRQTALYLSSIFQQQQAPSDASGPHRALMDFASIFPLLQHPESSPLASPSTPTFSLGPSCQRLVYAWYQALFLPVWAKRAIAAGANQGRTITKTRLAPSPTRMHVPSPIRRSGRDDTSTSLAHSSLSEFRSPHEDTPSAGLGLASPPRLSAAVPHSSLVGTAPSAASALFQSLDGAMTATLSAPSTAAAPSSLNGNARWTLSSFSPFQHAAPGVSLASLAVPALVASNTASLSPAASPSDGHADGAAAAASSVPPLAVTPTFDGLVPSSWLSPRQSGASLPPFPCVSGDVGDQFALCGLPHEFHSFFSSSALRTCAQCRQRKYALHTNTGAQNLSVCLLCGACVCLTGSSVGPGSSTPSKCYLQHLLKCDGRIGLYLMFKRGGEVLCLLHSTGGTAACFWPSLYLDRYGESDHTLQRGRPLFLHAGRLRALTQQYTFMALQDHITSHAAPLQLQGGGGGLGFGFGAPRPNGQTGGAGAAGGNVGAVTVLPLGAIATANRQRAAPHRLTMQMAPTTILPNNVLHVHFPLVDFDQPPRAQGEQPTRLASPGPPLPTGTNRQREQSPPANPGL